MVAHQTKSFKGNHKPLFLVALGVIGMGIFLALYVSGMFSFAAPRISEELKNLELSNGLKRKLIDEENAPQVLERFLPNSSIRNSDKVTVDGVVSVAQYLTSLVLESPSSSRDSITLNYDAELNALRIDGNINANALTIGASNTGSQGSATIGGTKNNVLFSQNGLVVGGERNQIQANAHNAVVVGSEEVNVTPNNSDVLAIGTVSSNFRGGNQVVGVIGGEVDSQRAKNSVALGQGRKKLSGPTSILMGGAIDSSRADHVFVWSDKNEIFNPQQSNAFYVNSVNGLGLNTRKPTTQLDIGKAGALKVALNRVHYCNAESKGIVSYTLGADNQLKSFCGCDGKRWVPLAGDMSPKAVAACAKQHQMACTGTVKNADKGASSAYPLRNPDANGGEGDWEALGWKYEKENTPLGACKFNCKVGFHPGADDPEGWLPPKSCIACTTFANRYDAGVNSGWKTAGTGDNNCDFGCKASFKYQNEGQNKRSCSDCEIGTYTLDNNQDKSCKNCKSPARLWRDTNQKRAINLTNSYFHFTTKGTGENACNFECAPRYRYFYNGAGSSKNGYIGKYTRVDGNACIYCKIGTWSVGGQTPRCTKCSNAPAKIDYWVNGTKSVLENFTTYTTNGANNDCGRKCRSELGLKESGLSLKESGLSLKESGLSLKESGLSLKESGLSLKESGLSLKKSGLSLKESWKSCICQNGKHLEGGKCEPNQKVVNCDKTGLPSGEGVSITENEKVTIKWEGKWNNGSWSSPKKCKWKCKTGYKKSGNICILKQRGKCADRYQNRLLDDLKQTDSLCDIGEKKKFSFNAATNTWNWSCVGDAGTVSCSARKRSPYEWKCIYVASHDFGGKCVSKASSATNPSRKGCWQDMPGYDVRCNKRGTKTHSPNCSIKLNGACSDSRKNCEKCKREPGGIGKPYWIEEGLGLAICEYIKTQKMCEEHIKCEWIRDTFGVATLEEKPVCVDKSAPNDRSKDSKNPDRDCKDRAPDCVCLSGYTLQNGSCVKLGGKCIGSNFENATLIPGDDKNLETDVPKTLVVNDTPAKCEYKCNAGYTWQNGICAKKPRNYCRKDEVSNGKCVSEAEGTATSSCCAGQGNGHVSCNQYTTPTDCVGKYLDGSPMGRPTGCTWTCGGAPEGGDPRRDQQDGAPKPKRNRGTETLEGGNSNRCSYQKDEASCKKSGGCKWENENISREVCVNEDTDTRVDDSYCKGALYCSSHNEEPCMELPGCGVNYGHNNFGPCRCIKTEYERP